MSRSSLYYLSREKQFALARAMVLAERMPKPPLPGLRLRLAAATGQRALAGRLVVLAREAATTAGEA